VSDVLYYDVVLSLFLLSAFYLILQFGCGLDEDYYFRLEMHASLFNGMVDVLEEIWTKQQQRQPESSSTTTKTASSSTTSLLPLQKQGNWEVIYAGGSASGDVDNDDDDDVGGGGKAFRYPGYTRSRDKAGCNTK